MEMNDKYKTKCFIDTLGGDLSGRIFSMMPDGSEMIALGNITCSNLNLETTEFYMHSKKVMGFNLIKYMREELSADKKK
jgi:hypothetical protein